MAKLTEKMGSKAGEFKAACSRFLCCRLMVHDIDQKTSRMNSQSHSDNELARIFELLPAEAAPHVNTLREMLTAIVTK